MIAARRAWIAIVVAGLAVWANTVDNQFHYDDYHSIVDNHHVRSLDSVPEFFVDPAMFSVLDKGMYRPLLMTTFVLNFAVGGFEVSGYHAVNVAVHVANAALVWWLAGLLGAGPRGRLLAGLLFVVHPVCSEPVNYISSRSESLAAGFYLLGLCLFLRAERGSPRLRVGVWLALAAGLLTKSTAITLVAVLLLLDLLVVSAGDWRRVVRRLLTHHVPGWAVAAGYIVIVIANGWLTRSLSQEVRSPWAQLFTQLKGLGYYLKLIAVPTHLSVDPQFVEQSKWTATVSLPLLLAVTLVIGAAWMWRRRLHRGLFLLSWLVLYSMPTVVKPLTVLVNERRAYVSLAVLCVAGGLLLVPAVRGLRSRPVLAAAAAIVLAVLSFQRNGVWADDFSLWRDAVHKSPRMARPHLYLGNAHKDVALHSTDPARRRQHWRAADQSFERAHTEARDLDLTLRALNNRGGVRFALGQDFAALQDTQLALQEYEAASAVWREAVARNSVFDDALINLGSASLTRARYAPDLRPDERRRLTEEGVGYYERGLEVRPDHYQGHGNLGVALEDLGDLERAEIHYRRAVFLKPDDWMTLKNLANLLHRLVLDDPASSRTGEGQARLEESRHLIRRALRLNPAVPGGRQVLAAVEAHLDEIE